MSEREYAIGETVIINDVSCVVVDTNNEESDYCCCKHCKETSTQWCALCVCAVGYKQPYIGTEPTSTISSECTNIKCKSNERSDNKHVILFAKNYGSNKDTTEEATT
jgi:hypothetical protein